jgi:hypothetical protein
MPAPKTTEAEFMAAWTRHKGHGPSVAKEVGTNLRNAMRRRRRIEAAAQVQLPSSPGVGNGFRAKEYVEKIGSLIKLELKTGTVVCFGDLHLWPGDRPAAFDALVRFIRKSQPQIVICNGDLFDLPRISRHPPVGWAKMPDVKDELEYCQRMMNEIEEASPPKAKLCFNLGNHDSRWTARLASQAPEFVGVPGMDIVDFFPLWNFAWATEINDSVVAKHRYHGGIHATYANTLKSGRTMVTNHLHRLCVTPITDYNGRRYGVDCGTISDFGPSETKFSVYTELNPVNWASGFAVLTFKNGKLLPPELATVDGKITFFRGEPI